MKFEDWRAFLVFLTTGQVVNNTVQENKTLLVLTPKAPSNYFWRQSFLHCSTVLLSIPCTCFAESPERAAYPSMNCVYASSYMSCSKIFFYCMERIIGAVHAPISLEVKFASRNIVPPPPGPVATHERSSKKRTCIPKQKSNLRASLLTKRNLMLLASIFGKAVL